DLEELKGRWEEVADLVARRSPRLGAFLREGRPRRLEDGVLELAFGSTFHRDAVNRQRRVVEEVLKEVFGTKLRVRVLKEEVEGEQYEDERMLKKVLELFDGEVVQG
ncbi:MAG: hypothetical protein DRP94_03130, partial [Candidatus Latescibacterota bacterium]